MGKKRDKMSTEDLHKSANIQSPWQQAFYGPTKLLQAIMHSELPSKLYKEIVKNIAFKIRTNTWNITMDHLSEMGKLRLPNSIREAADLLPEDLCHIKPILFKNALRKKIMEHIPTKP